MNLYGIYQHAKNAAWQCLLDFGISSLPVDLMQIATQAEIQLVKNSDVDELSGDESGMCTLVDGKWFLIYDDEAPLDHRRVTIAHELGHIFLGHQSIRGHDDRNADSVKVREERDADTFAIRLLAPVCVLWALDLHTAQEIQDTCVISAITAKKHAERMKVLYERQKFLTSAIERKVYNQFDAYLKNK